MPGNAFAMRLGTPPSSHRLGPDGSVDTMISSIALAPVLHALHGVDGVRVADLAGDVDRAGAVELADAAGALGQRLLGLGVARRLA